MEWQPISTAPKGARVLCGRADWEPCFLVWKTNRRIVSAHKDGQWPDLAESYFGDPFEDDDYELAKPGNGPTHWLKIPALTALAGEVHVAESR